MATWGSGSFQNHLAADWIAELEDANDWTPVREALQAVSADETARDADACCLAIAAADVVAVGRGRPPEEDIPASVTAYTKRVGSTGIDDELLSLANRAVMRVFEESDLRDQWEEGNDFDSWQSTMGDLLDRLEPTAGRPML